MKFELVQAIQQISEELSKTSGWDKASVFIGGIGIILTLIVLWYNHKSIELTQRSIRQAIDLQLFEKRLELYNAIKDDTAFYNAPLSLKIAYNEEIYNLYVEIAELCEKRWTKIKELAQSLADDNILSMPYGNTCYELFEMYRNLVEYVIINDISLHLPDGMTICPKNHMNNTKSIHEEICKEYSLLETKMKTYLEQSIKT